MKKRLFILLFSLLFLFVLSACGNISGNGNPIIPTSPSPSQSAEPTPSQSGEPAPSPSPSESADPQPTDDPAPEPTDDPEPEPTDDPEPDPTDDPEPEPTDDPEPEPTDDPEPDPTDDPEPEPTDDPEPDPTDDPEPDPTDEPEPDPTDEPEPDPTDEPEPEPTPFPPVGETVESIPTAIEIHTASNAASLTTEVGQPFRLSVAFAPATAHSGIVWVSSDPSVASVDDWGNVTPLRKGTATITAYTWNHVQDTFELRVEDALPSLTFELNAYGSGYVITGCLDDVTTITIPATFDGFPVTGIAPGAFKDCQKLRLFTVDIESEYFYAENGAVYTDSPVKTLVCVPPAYDGDLFSVSADTQVIAARAFAGTNRLTSVSFPEGVVELGDGAFAEARTNLRVFLPDSLTTVGEDLTQQSTAHFFGHGDTAAHTWAAANGVPYTVIEQQANTAETIVTTDPTTLHAAIPVPYNGKIVTVPENPHRDAALLENAVSEQFYDLTSYQLSFSGEVLLDIDSQWSEIIPDPNGMTLAHFPPQTGLYGAGYTAGHATLRAYDLRGNLLAMQEVSGDFVFSFPGARTLSIEGGLNTKLTVLPVEPVFVAAPGTATFDPDSWYERADGNMFHCFILCFPNGSVSLDLPTGTFASHEAFDCTTLDTGKTARFLIAKVSSGDPGRLEELRQASIRITA